METHAFEILWPGDINDGIETRVGGKAAGLARLARLRSRVPPWFAIPADFCARHLAALTRSPDEVDAEARVRDATLSAETREAIAAALVELGPGPYAVRSSMVGEDSGANSFAGQLESYLCFEELDDVIRGVKSCWASAFSSRVRAYRARAGLGGQPKVAVVVQRIVCGSVSGVAFSAHPVTGCRDQVFVNATWGLGEGLVSGECNADEFVWQRGTGTESGREVSSRISPKEVQVVPSPSATGTTSHPVDRKRARARCLSKAALREVVHETTRIAAAIGAPQDVEWTWKDQEGLFILQTRPITRAPSSEDPALRVFNNSNIQESYGGVTTPLTFSFASSAYANVYRQTMRVLGMSEAHVREQEPMLQNLLALIRGRIYYNICNWYRGLLLLPSFDRNKADMEEMMGLDQPVDFIQDEQLSLAERLSRLPDLLRTAGRLLWRFGRLERDVEGWLRRFNRAYQRIDRARIADASLPELMKLGRELQSRFLDRWHVPIVNDFRVMMTTGRLRRKLETAGVEHPAALLNQLLAGELGIESTEPVRELLALGGAARRDPDLRADLHEGEASECLERIRTRHPEFSARLDRYLARFGDRCMGELKLETVSPREDPSFVVRVLRNYSDDTVRDLETGAESDQQARLEAETDLKDRLGRVAAWRLRRLSRAARGSVKNRENMRLARTRVFGLYRALYRAAGRRLFELGRLAHEEDVFYLTTDEIEAFCEGRSTCTTLDSLAELRKAEFRGYEQDEPPHHVEVHGSVYLAPTALHRTEATSCGVESVLQGTGCFPGRVEGRARLVRSPCDDLDLRGRILVARCTDPGWTPLFPGCAGIVVERGSTLSHAAIVARELGIPTVVGVPDLMRQLRDGERLRIDGAQGVVERLDSRTMSEEEVAA